MRTRWFPVVSLLLVVAFGAAVLPAVVETAAAHGYYAAAKKAKKKKVSRRKLLKALKQGGLSQLPSAAGALAGNTRSRNRTAVAGDVSGTPPALVDIATHPIGDVFWAAGSIDRLNSNAATPEDCNSFWAGTVDGQSGGLGACHMAENVGRSLASVLGAQNSLCYMQNFPTPENVAAGGVQVTSGELPEGDITHLFNAPADAPRIVEVMVTGKTDDGGGQGGQGGQGGGGGSQQVFLKIYGATANRAAGNLYRADLWFCNGDPTAVPREYNTMVLTNAGRFEVDSAANEGGYGGVRAEEVVGYVTGSGLDLAWDTTRPRTATTVQVRGDGAYKSAIEIGGDNRILSKGYDLFGSEFHKVYAVAQFSGTGADDVRFLAGAFREKNAFGSPFTGAAEFRDTFYAAAPGSALIADANAVDLDSDAFYAAPPALTVDTSGYSCGDTPDVVITMDFANSTLAASVAGCENEAFHHMYFCHDDGAVNGASEAFQSTCH